MLIQDKSNGYRSLLIPEEPKSTAKVDNIIYNHVDYFLN